MKIKGIIAATFAAYYNEGSLNKEIIPSIVDKLVAEKVSGVFVGGTNGEGLNMTVEERMEVAEAYVKAARNRLLVIVHVGHTSIKECRKLAVHALNIHADAISAVAAFYFKPVSVQNLVDCMAEIASSAPDLPFYYYHIPNLTGVRLNMVEFLRLGEKTIPNLAGIKYTASTLNEYQACLNYGNGKFDILYGYDEMLMSALAVGAEGAVGSTYTFAAPVYLKIIELYQSGRQLEARDLQSKMVDVISCIVKYPSIAAQRAVMQMLGIDLGVTRLPLTPLAKKDFNQLKAELEKIHFFTLLKNFSTDRC